MSSLCEMISAELARHIVPSLSSVPSVLGATIGIEEGKLIRMTMNEREEYVGARLEHRVQVAGRSEADGTSFRLLHGPGISILLQ
jgi:hypothetical protein